MAAGQIRRSLTDVTTEIAVAPPPTTFFRRPRWEGELAMNPVPGSTPQIFPFTVRDEDMAKRLKEAEGKRVALRYKEKRGLPSSCFGDTNDFISKVRVLGP